VRRKAATRWIARTTAITLTLTLCACSEIRSAKLLAPSWFGYTRLAEGVYVDTGASPGEQRAVLATIDAARARVASVFGEASARPRIIACSTDNCFVRSGGKSARGKTYGSSAILLSPRGLDPVIVAHELTHAELRHRIGDFTAWRNVPAWFDEGLAVLVSSDPRYSDAEWLDATRGGRSAPNLATLGKSTPWHYDNWQSSYGTARRAVGEWHSKVGNEGLARLIEKLRAGGSFEAAFRSP
jgi:hypothetical protein